MDLSLSEELHLFSQELQRFLSPIVLQEIAKQVGFVQRSSKYQADELIALCVWLSQEVASTSLTQLCSRLTILSSEISLQQYGSLMKKDAFLIREMRPIAEY